MDRRYKKPGLLALAVCAPLLVPNMAAMAAEAATPPEKPLQTTATYGNWTVRCRADAEGGEAKLCEMVQSLTAANAKGAIANIALGKPSEGVTMRLVVQIPNAVTLTEPVKISIAGDDLASLPYQTCFPNFCVAQTELSLEAIERFKAAGDFILAFQDRTRRTVNVKASLKGFTAAYTQLTATN